jgi:hypothetical protein
MSVLFPRLLALGVVLGISMTSATAIAGDSDRFAKPASFGNNKIYQLADPEATDGSVSTIRPNVPPSGSIYGALQVPPPVIVYLVPRRIYVAPAIRSPLAEAPPSQSSNIPMLLSGGDMTIRDIQQQLTARGYYGGPLDGQLDDYTRTALSVYQSDVQLPVTGEPDLVTASMLHFGPDIYASIAPIVPPKDQRTKLLNR